MISPLYADMDVNQSTPTKELSLGTRKLVQANPNTQTVRIALPLHRVRKYRMTPGEDYEIREKGYQGGRAFVIPIPATDPRL